MQGCQAFFFLKMATRYRRNDENLIFLGMWGAVIILGMLAFNFFASSFGLRGFALWYGIGTGLLIGARTAQICEKKLFTRTNKSNVR